MVGGGTPWGEEEGETEVDKYSLEALVKNKPTAPAMRRLWEAAHRGAYPGERVDGWARRHEPVMRRFAEEAGDPMLLIVEVVADWRRFSDAVRSRTGDRPPGRPRSWFLARHLATAEAVVGGGVESPWDKTGKDLI